VPHHLLTVDFFFYFLTLWENGQSVINLAYDTCLRKWIYGWNQHDNMVAMKLVSSDSENIHFLALFSPVRLLDPILDHHPLAIQARWQH
jgi:hypothetical protein